MTEMFIWNSIPNITSAGWWIMIEKFKKTAINLAISCTLVIEALPNCKSLLWIVWKLTLRNFVINSRLNPLIHTLKMFKKKFLSKFSFRKKFSIRKILNLKLILFCQFSQSGLTYQSLKCPIERIWTVSGKFQILPFVYFH